MGLDPASVSELHDVLRIIGGGSLSLGRLYEGHVNAVRLVVAYGAAAQMAILVAEIDAGRLSGVWNAEQPPGLAIADGRLCGTKIYTSGAGHVLRPIATAAVDGGVQMLLANVALARVEIASWTAQGMRATATGSVDFTGVPVCAEELLGAPGDYYRAPLFSGGAWRVLAVQLGGLEQLVAIHADRLRSNGRSNDPIQRARFGEAAARLEMARLLSQRAAHVAENPEVPPPERDAIVNFARHGFERAALEIIERVQRGIGLGSMLRPEPVERIIRDLATYLRQPFIDGALDAAAGWLLDTRRDPHCPIGEPL